jgi:hypothetical protein
MSKVTCVKINKKLMATRCFILRAGQKGTEAFAPVRNPLICAICGSYRSHHPQTCALWAHCADFHRYLFMSNSILP